MTNQPQPDAVAGPGAHRPLVLVVEDHEVGRTSLARLLGALGYEVVAVADGISALSTMKELKNLEFVLTDLRLPDLDGRDVVHAARQLVPTPRIALITGWDIEPDEVEKLGLSWVFLKPLDVQEIVAKLRSGPPTDPVPGRD